MHCICPSVLCQLLTRKQNTVQRSNSDKILPM